MGKYIEKYITEGGDRSLGEVIESNSDEDFWYDYLHFENY